MGDWSGTTDSGHRVRSEAFLILGGCALLELTEIEGDGASDLKLARVTAFDRDTERWIQYRIDNRTPVFERLEGVSSEGALELTAVAPASGETPLHRTRWRVEADGRLRIEEMESTDGGATWTVDRIARLENRRIR